VRVVDAAGAGSPGGAGGQRQRGWATCARGLPAPAHPSGTIPTIGARRARLLPDTTVRRTHHALCALLGLLAACAAAAPAGAVVGGTEVAPETVPWFVSLGGCGGTLVAADRVLTAAHCVAGRSPADFARLMVGGVMRDATRVAMHANRRRMNGYRDFIGDPSPTWAPTRTGHGDARISGGARPGRRLSCLLRAYVPQRGARIGYAWKIVGAGRGGYSRPRVVGRGRTYRISPTDRGHRLACIVSASNAGGFVTVGAANRVVAR
jgi:trypsin